MTDESTSTPAFHALAVVLRDYLSYGEDGMEDLKQEVHSRRRKPVLEAFTKEVQQVLADEAPVPTALINKEFRRRAEEHAAANGGEGADVEVLQYDDQQAYEALADLWEYLELASADDPDDAPGGTRGLLRNTRSQMLWVQGDPVQALRSWISWRSLALFLVGTAVSIGCWTAYEHVTVGFVRTILLLLTLLGFAAAMAGGGALWLRRVRYVNPDAFLPAEDTSKRRRRR